MSRITDTKPLYTCIDTLFSLSSGFMNHYTKTTLSKFIQRFMTSSCLMVGSLGWSVLPGICQISSDGTLPVPTSINQNGSIFTITNGTQAAGNLFHSFSQFSVPAGGSAVFNTSQYSGIQNLFSRVTGGSVSTIDGTIQVRPTGVNFFLLNPNGIIFGPNARLNIGGSFLATTGSSIRFADGTEFSANAQTPPLLTVSVPIGVQLGSNPGRIQVDGSADLQTTSTSSPLTTPNNTFSLLGGEIQISGGPRGQIDRPTITALSGRIELGSVAGNNFVSLNFINQGFTLGYSQVQSFQDIQLLSNAQLYANNGGNIQIQGRQIQILGGSQIGMSNRSDTLLGGSVTVNASESIEVLGTGVNLNPSLIFNRARSIQDAGLLTLNTKRLIVKNGGQISASTFSAGQGGSLVVNSSESVEVSGVSPDSRGFTGLSVQSNPGSTGNAGSLLINTNLLTVKDGGRITATTFSSGQGGDIIVNAADVQLIGGSRTQVNGLFAQAGSDGANIPTATGQGGSLTVNTGSLLVQDGSRISTGTFTLGNAGSLVINAGEVTVAGRSLSDQSPSLISASSVSAGAAGNLSIFADRVTVKDGGTISVSGIGTGVAGNLQIDSPFILLENQGKLLAETKAGQGNIILNTSDLRLRYNSLISTNATGRATGGNISIFTQTLAAFENSDITANAEESFGGRVTIRSAAIFGTQFRLFLTPESDITATSALGPDFSGSVTLQTLGIDPSQGIIPLESDILDLSQLVVAACSPGRQQATGEFFVTGRGGLPTTPSEAATDNRILMDLGRSDDSLQSSPLVPSLPSSSSEITNTRMGDTDQILQAQGWVVNTDGKITLTAQSTPSTPNNSSVIFSICDQLNSVRK